MPDPWLRIKVEADAGAEPLVAMFEPSGMTYDVAPGEHMFADVAEPVTNDIQIISWTGGISIWAPGSVVTPDSDGAELHRLN
jgi:hypothetical protein